MAEQFPFRARDAARFLHSAIDGYFRDFGAERAKAGRKFRRCEISAGKKEFFPYQISPPPEFGEIIELLRNQEALVNAGARTIQLPAQGTVVFPRITSPTTAGTYGENMPNNDSTIGTGHLTLSAKKIMSMVQVPNELFRYAGPATEFSIVSRYNLLPAIDIYANVRGRDLGGVAAEVEQVLAQLRENPAVMFARAMEFRG